MNYISKTSTSNIDLSFVNETITQLIAKNRITDNFKIIEEYENGNLIQSTDEVQSFINEEINQTLDGSLNTPQLVDDKQLEVLIVATIATLKRKNKKCESEEVFKLDNESLETGFIGENFNECLGERISNKSVEHNIINSRERLSLLKDEINHDGSNSNDDTITHDNTISQLGPPDCSLGDRSSRRFFRKPKNVNDCLEVEDPNVNFISHKNVNPRSHLNQDRLHPNRRGQYMTENKSYI